MQSQMLPVSRPAAALPAAVPPVVVPQGRMHEQVDTVLRQQSGPSPVFDPAVLARVEALKAGAGRATASPTTVLGAM